MSKDYDIVIVGAGLVGTSLALALQGQGFRIALVDKQLDVIANPKKTDTRPLSLAYASYVMLDTLGVWSDLAKYACPIKAVEVSDQGAFGSTRFKASEMNAPALGYVVPFSVLQQSLYQRAVADSSVDALSVKALTGVDSDEQGAVVSVETDAGLRKLTAQLLVGADGANSTVRDLLRINTEYHDAKESALTAELELALPHDGVAYERFTTQGALALLPLSDERRARLVWTMSQASSEAVGEWDDLTLLKSVQACFAGRVDAIQSIKRGASYPLQTIMAKESVRPSAVLLGNAAHTIYPLAAQGFNLGLRDVATLAEVLAHARQQVQPLGAMRVLQEYDQWAATHQDHITRLTQGISTLFDLQLPLLKKCRGLGLLAMDVFSPVKRRLARRAMGLAGRLPKLARGISLT